MRELKRELGRVKTVCWVSPPAGLPKARAGANASIARERRAERGHPQIHARSDGAYGVARGGPSLGRLFFAQPPAKLVGRRTDPHWRRVEAVTRFTRPTKSNP